MKSTCRRTGAGSRTTPIWVGRMAGVRREVPRVHGATSDFGPGGVQPQWRADGRELFYLALDGSLMVVPFESATGSVGGKPSVLFVTPFEPETISAQSTRSAVTVRGSSA